MVDEAVKEFRLVGVNLAAVTADGFTDALRLEDFYTRVEELGARSADTDDLLRVAAARPRGSPLA